MTLNTSVTSNIERKCIRDWNNNAEWTIPFLCCDNDDDDNTVCSSALRISTERAWKKGQTFAWVHINQGIYFTDLIHCICIQTVHKQNISLSFRTWFVIILFDTGFCFVSKHLDHFCLSLSVPSRFFLARLFWASLSEHLWRSFYSYSQFKHKICHTVVQIVVGEDGSACMTLDNFTFRIRVVYLQLFLPWLLFNGFDEWMSLFCRCTSLSTPTTTISNRLLSVFFFFNFESNFFTCLHSWQILLLPSLITFTFYLIVWHFFLF